jgi:phosphatidylinositol-3,4,5-trisphosphate 3-phosphatase and dual-specificity protein phosphatase PTEN
LAPTTTAALRFFGEMRTSNGKGVTIPSQMRYVHYFETSLKRPVVPYTYRIRHFRLHTVPNFDVGGGCDPYFDVRLGDGKSLVFDWKAMLKGKAPKNYKPKHKIVDFDVWPHNIIVKGDVKIVFYDHDNFSTPDKMFHFWFNTGFIDNNYLLLHKDVLDRACKDKACKEFEPEFKIEIFLDMVDDSLFESTYGPEKARAFLGGTAEKGEGYLDADNDEDLNDDDDA